MHSSSSYVSYIAAGALCWLGSLLVQSLCLHILSPTYQIFVPPKIQPSSSNSIYLSAVKKPCRHFRKLENYLLSHQLISYGPSHDDKILFFVSLVKSLPIAGADYPTDIVVVRHA